MITIVNLKGITGRGVERVDRSSVLGNPFKMSNEKDRTLVISKYKSWLWKQIQNREPNVIKELGRLKQIALKGNLNIGCWCTPKSCHAEIIKAAIEWAISKGGSK